MSTQLNGQDLTQMENLEVAAEPPADLIPQIDQSTLEFVEGLELKKRLLAEQQRIAQRLQDNEVRLIAIQGFLGIMYRTYPGLPQTPGVLPEEK